MQSTRDLMTLADMALVPPPLNTHPLPQYGYDRLDYGMTMSIERTRGGRLWSLWVGGGDNSKAFFVLATSDDKGATWSPPRLVIDPHDPAHALPLRVLVGHLWLDPRDRLWLFFDQSVTNFDGRAGTWYTRCDNPDADLPQWTPPVRIWHGNALNKPIVLDSGEWMLPVSLWHRQRIGTVTPETSEVEKQKNHFADCFHELDGFRMANVIVSRDQGVTWEWRGGVAFPNPDFDEHHCVQKRDGTIWMTARTATHGIWQSFSHDGGATWTPPEPWLAHVNARFFLRRLRSGRLLLIKHGIPVDTRPKARSHLAAYLSEDDGSTWLGGLMLDEREGVSYPDGAVFPDGDIFIQYDFNRDSDGEILFARFREDDILAGRLVSPGAAMRQLVSRPNPVAVAARHAARKEDLRRRIAGDSSIPFVHIPHWRVWDAVWDSPQTYINDNCGSNFPALSSPLPVESTSVRDGSAGYPIAWRKIAPNNSGQNVQGDVTQGCSHSAGFVSFECIAPARDGKIGYACAWVRSPDARTTTFLLGADFWMLFRVNGTAYIDHSCDLRPWWAPDIYEFRRDIPLKAGWNLLEVKIASGALGFAFACQIGNPGDLQFASEPPIPT